MRVIRSPLRVTLGGGGSDLEEGGLCIAAAISVYIYVAVHENHTDEYVLRYSQIERTKTVGEIHHPLLRESLRLTDTKPGVEIASFSDVPAQSGLGSSGAFTVATLHALGLDQRQAAETACTIDVGWQDQWASALGGVRAITQDGSTRLNLSDETVRKLNTNLHLYDTRFLRDARQVLRETPRPPRDVLIQQAHDTVKALEAGDMREFGSCLHDQWMAKLGAATTVEHHQVDYLMRRGMTGQWGSKLVGAGNGGYILAYSEDPITTDLTELPFSLDFKGVTRCT